MSSEKSNTIPSEISPSVETLTIHWSPTDTRCYVCTNMDHTDIGIMVEDYKHVWSTFDPNAAYGNSNLVDDLTFLALGIDYYKSGLGETVRTEWRNWEKSTLRLPVFVRILHNILNLEK
jgi:hypothetical protein